MSTAEEELRGLMLASLAGDAAAYRGLLTTLAEQLRRFYRRKLSAADANVEDLVQEALIAIHTKRDTYDTSQPLTPWVYAIARYKLLDHLRRRRIRATLPLESASDVFVADESEAALIRHDLEKLLASLPPSSRAVVRSVKLDGFSTGEVAAASGRTEIAVRVGLHRALRALSTRLREGTRRADH